MATSSRVDSNESVFARRKRQRVQNYASGRARSAYRFQQSLDDGFSSSSSTPGGVGRPCKRHCSLALGGLREAFAAVGKHPAKVLQKRMASYPTPKKQKLAHQNFTGMQYYYKIINIHTNNKNNNNNNNNTQPRTDGFERTSWMAMAIFCFVKSVL